MDDILKRINELANKSKIESLSDMEKLEQKRLRKEYIERFRGNIKNSLLNLKIVDEEGNDVTPEKLKKEQDSIKKDKH